MNAQVEIAKDVLKLIEMENVVINGGCYFSVFKGDDVFVTTCDMYLAKKSIEDNFGNTISQVLETTLEKGATCQLCALAAMLVAKARLTEVTTFSDSITKVLKKYFDITSLALIEFAFEGGSNGIVMDSDLFGGSVSFDEDGEEQYTYESLTNGDDISGSDIVNAKAFYHKYRHDAKKRLQIIMQHIIDNGSFDLDVLCHSQ